MLEKLQDLSAVEDTGMPWDLVRIVSSVFLRITYDFFCYIVIHVLLTKRLGN